MITTQQFIIGNYSIPTTYLIFAFFGFISFYFYWTQGKKDGFNKEKLGDLFFSILILTVLATFGYSYYLRFYPVTSVSVFHFGIGSYILANIGLIYFLTKKWRWSIFRIFDLFSLFYFSLVVSYLVSKIVVYGFTGYAIHLVLFSFLYLYMFIKRNETLSGFTFSAFLLMCVVILQLTLGGTSYLIFYISLITISIVNIVYRGRKSMFKSNFSSEFLKKLKSKLTSKKERLQSEQKRLIEDDPYLNEGRDVGNAEEIDEAILEDRAKEELDIKKSNIEDMQDQVDKALTKMEEGNYGVCEVCGEVIDKARLEAYPEATTCLKHSS